MFTLHHTLRPRPGTLDTQPETNDLVLLHLETTTYCSRSRVGMPIWQRLKQRLSLNAATSAVRGLAGLFISLSLLFGASEALSQPNGRDKPLAQIGGAVITVGEFRQRVRQLPSSLRLTLGTEDGRRAALDWMIDWALTLDHALRQGIDKEPTTAARIAAAREKIIVAEHLNRQVREAIVIPEAALRDYYTRNHADFKVSEAVKISNILVRSEEEAQEILRALREGADFADLARERSLDPSRRNGGQMGWVERRVLDPAFATAAFSLAKGETSGVVHTKFGYHIIKVDDKRNCEYAAYEAVKNGIRERLIEKQGQEVVERFRKVLRSEVEVKVDEEVLRTMEIDGRTETPPVP